MSILGINTPYSNVERHLFKHFETDELCEFFYAHQLYKETAIKAFMHPNKYAHKYEDALRECLELFENQGKMKIYRMTAEWDNTILNWIGK